MHTTFIVVVSVQILICCQLSTMLNTSTFIHRLKVLAPLALYAAEDFSDLVVNIATLVHKIADFTGGIHHCGVVTAE